jgi:hypothetical protein
MLVLSPDVVFSAKTIFLAGSHVYQTRDIEAETGVLDGFRQVHEADTIGGWRRNKLDKL